MNRTSPFIYQFISLTNTDSKGEWAKRAIKNLQNFSQSYNSLLFLPIPYLNMHIRCYPCSWYRRDCPHRSLWGKVSPTDRMAASLDLWAWVQEREGVCTYPFFFLSHRKAYVTSSSPDSLIQLSQIVTTQFDKQVNMSPITQPCR